MKRNNTPKFIKSILTVCLAAAITAFELYMIPAGAAGGQLNRETITFPEPLKVIDFDRGFHEFAMEDDNYEIVRSKQCYVVKEGEEIDKNDKVDANGLLYVGEGEQARYYQGYVSNQPTSKYDDEKGTYLQMGRNRVIPAIYKKKSAGLEDEKATKCLDQMLPYETAGSAGYLVQDEYIANSEFMISNPLADETIAKDIQEKEGLTISYWIKAPANEDGGYKPSSVLRWENVKISDGLIQKDGELQIDINNSLFWSTDAEESEVSYALSGDQTISPVTSAVSGGSLHVGGNCNEWHQVTITMRNNEIEFYTDGQCTEIYNHYSECRGWKKESELGDTNTRLLDWITNDNTRLHFGGAGNIGQTYGMSSVSCDFSLDDLRIYGGVLTEQQIQKLYQKDVEDWNAEKDTARTELDMTNITVISDGVQDAVQTSVDTIDHHEVYTIHVNGINRIYHSAGAKIDNPFAGKNLQGATIGYWIKQDDTDKTSAISFMDEEKPIYHPKGSIETAASILYVENAGESIYAEGYSEASVCNSVQNLFYTALDKEGKTALLNETAEWMYITLTMTNDGINYYINGEPLEKRGTTYTTRNSRFLDGYYQSQRDAEDVTAKYGVFGTINNQGTTTLMEFLTAEDTAIYLGYYPIKGMMGNNLTSACSFAGFKSVDSALTADEVKEFYEERCEGLTIPEVPSAQPSPSASSDQPDPSANPSEKPLESMNPEITDSPADIKPGDIDGNRKVTLEDAQLALKAALKIIILDGEKLEAADINHNGKVDLEDAQFVLKAALKIIVLQKKGS